MTRDECIAVAKAKGVLELRVSNGRWVAYQFTGHQSQRGSWEAFRLLDKLDKSLVPFCFDGEWRIPKPKPPKLAHRWTFKCAPEEVDIERCVREAGYPDAIFVDAGAMSYQLLNLDLGKVAEVFGLLKTARSVAYSLLIIEGHMYTRAHGLTRRQFINVVRRAKELRAKPVRTTVTVL